MSKSGIRSFFIILFLVISSFFNIGSSSFVVEGEAKKENITINEGSKAVCYNARTGTKYTSIEKALLVAKEDTANNDTIYVIPGTNPTIMSDCEIASGDTLCLPYEDDGTTHNYYSRENQSGVTFADSNASLVSTNRKSLVTLNNDITITNNGTIEIGGILGTGVSGQKPTGHTTNSYSEILMKSKSKIINNGILNINGYIKEDSKNNGSQIENSSSSSVKMPFVIYDFRGGSYSYACYKENVMPFNNYDLPNCQVLQKYYYGSKLTGMVTIYASAWSTPDVLVLGTSSDTCLFKLSSGYFTIKYNPSNVLYTTNDLSSSTTSTTANYTEIHSYGNISLSSLKISLSVGVSVTIDTSKMYCPLGYKFQIFIESGTLSIDNKMKFLGGSLLTVNSSGTLSCNANVSFYNDYIPAIETGGTNLYPSAFSSAVLVVNGTININSAFGGLIETTANTGFLNTSSNFSSSVSILEVLTSSGSSFLASADKTETNSEDALAYLGSSSKPSSPSLLSASSNFESKGDYWYLPLSDITSASISPSSGASAANTAGVFELTASVLPVENSSSNISYSWSCDSGATLSSTSGQSVTLTTPANSSTSSNKTYNVTCTVTFTKSDGSTGSVSATGTFTATKKNSCVTGDTLISLSDGSFKQIKDITYDDSILAFDHFTGQKVETSAAIIFVHDQVQCQKLTLRFSDGTYVEVLDNHEFFDLTLNKYVEINELTYQSYIGHQFAKIIGDTGLTDYNSVILNSVNITTTYEKSYSIQSAVNINFITNTMLSRTVPAYEGWFDYFDFGNPLTYDPIKMDEDITNYGLYDYSDFEYFGVTEEQFIAFNGPYLKVLVGKGIVTFDDIINLISRYVI
ncbi:MAG: hypothetical protein PUG37_06900 [Bacillales bacterium]|nr:hypothetical protein [Erysipelotrichaceae bacterium]MDD7382481.1 hypothetical protein [Bacillales bacterium]